MRHKRVGRKLGVVTKHRKAMFRNMATDLFRHDRIKTTDTRAKEIRRVAEKLITLAKKGTLSSRRQAAAFVKDKDVLKKLFGEIAEKFKDRPGGYTRIVKLGFRTGDNAPISLIELVDEQYKPKKKKSKKTPKASAKKTSKQTKSTKKESAEELGLLDDVVEAAASAEVVDEAVSNAAEADLVAEESSEVEVEETAQDLNAESEEPPVEVVAESTSADSESSEEEE